MGINFKSGLLYVLILLTLISCHTNESEETQAYSNLGDIGMLASDWNGKVIASSNQTTHFYDIEIGDADNNGTNDIVVVDVPKSRLSIISQIEGRWKMHLLAEFIANCYPCYAMDVEIADLNGDGENEILCGTGSAAGSKNMQVPAIFYVFQTDGERLTKVLKSQPSYEINSSRYTHGLAIGDIDNDGVKEVISAYCNRGHVIRYDVDKDLTSVRAGRVHKYTGLSGEGSLIDDIDNDGKLELVLVAGFQEDKARVEIFEFDSKGDLILPPRIKISGYDDKKCFEASVTSGDVDNDGKTELIIAWKRKEEINDATIIGYEVREGIEPVYTFAYEDADLDSGFLERNMVIGDADNDGENELLVSTIGKLGHVFMYELVSPSEIKKKLLVDFHESKATQSTLAIGDADNDGKNEVILATGIGGSIDIKEGASYTSYVALIEKK